MEQVSSDTLKTSLEIVGSIIPLFVWCVGGLCIAIVAMSAYIVWQQKQVVKLQKESTIALTNNTSSNNNLAKAIDDLKLVVINRKR